MVFQKSALNCIKSFLHNATPFWLKKHPSLPVRNLYSAIFQMIIEIILRIVANKQLTIEDLKQLASKFLTPQMLLVLLLVVGNLSPINTNILKEIFSSYMLIEPKYKMYILDAVNNNFNYIKNETFKMIKQVKNNLMDINLKIYFGNVSYNILNFVFTLKVLLEVCHPLALEFYKETIMFRTMYSFNKNVLPFISLIMKSFNSSNDLMWLKLASDQFQQVFKLIGYPQRKEVKSKL